MNQLRQIAIGCNMYLNEKGLYPRGLAEVAAGKFLDIKHLFVCLSDPAPVEVEGLLTSYGSAFDLTD